MMMWSLHWTWHLALFAVYIGIDVGDGIADDLIKTCPSHYDYLPQTHKCFSWHADGLDWYEARIRCQHEGGDLVVMKDKITENYVIQYLTQNSSFDRIWIGMRQIEDSSSFRWVDDNIVEYDAWKPQQPWHYAVNESVCVVYNSIHSIFGWNDIRCSKQRYSLCEKPLNMYPACPSGYVSYSKKKKCVNAVDNQVLSWGDARVVCQEDGGDLVIIQDDEYNTFIKSLLRDDHAYWIGLNNSGTSDFHWVDGSLVSYDQWKQNEPNFEGVSGAYVCGEIRVPRDDWNDFYCHESVNYICERDYTEPVSCLGETWILNGRNKKCYQVQTNARTFHESKAKCKEQGDDLANGNDRQTIDYLLGLIMGNTSQYWIDTLENDTNSCVGGLIQTLDPNVTQDVCDTPHPSVCERHTVRDYPVLECPHGYHTYVTTTTGWRIVCLMAENHQKKSWDDASNECRRDGGDLYDKDKDSDLHVYIRDDLLLEDGDDYWIKPNCYAYRPGDGVVEGGCGHANVDDDDNYYICKHSGILRSIASLTDFRDLIGEYVYDVNTDLTISLVELCHPQDLTQLYSQHTWIRTSSHAFVIVETNWTQSFIQDQISKCFVYHQQNECCAEITLNKPANVGSDSQLQMTFPISQSSCLCSPIASPDPGPVTMEVIHLLRNMTAPQNGSTPPDSLCPCRCDSVNIDYNPSPLELSRMLSKIQKELRMNVHEVSSSRNKKISAEDDRTESQAMGYIGVALCLIPIGLMVAIDLSTVFRRTPIDLLEQGWE